MPTILNEEDDSGVEFIPIEQTVLKYKGSYASSFNLEPVYLNLGKVELKVNGFDDSINEILSEQIYGINIQGGEFIVYFEDNLDITNRTLVERHIEYAYEHSMECPIDVKIELHNKKGDIFKSYDYKGCHIAAINSLQIDYTNKQNILKPFIVLSDWESRKILPEWKLENGFLIEKR